MEWLDYYNQEIVNLGAAQPCPEFVQVRTAFGFAWPIRSCIK